MAAHQSAEGIGSRKAYRMKGVSTRVIVHIVLIVAAVLIAFPFIWMVTRALMSPEELNTERFRLIHKCFSGPTCVSFGRLSRCFHATSSTAL
jgi:ABC-type glycerol-3-phosphate transport system permease component